MTDRSLPVASLSLDLDNEWSYRMIRGLPGWEERPSYLPLLVPRAIELCERLGAAITFFVVGLDAASQDAVVIGDLAQAGHEIGNHSYHHRPWMDRLGHAELNEEIGMAEEAIAAATGTRPYGYRGPGYSLSPATLDVLVDRGYRYDASTLPTWIGSIARAAYFRAAQMSPQERAERADLYGHLRDGLQPLRPHRWRAGTANGGSGLLEIPVTTMPVTRVPMHMSYLLALAAINERAARTYLASAIALCRARKVAPSMLLHPLDLLDDTEVPALGFFPGMSVPSATKLRLVESMLRQIAERFRWVSMAEHAAAIDGEPTGHLRLTGARAA